jgi:quercetin 2,3-dioxygenase
MTTTYYPAAQRGHVNYGWLDSQHSFSFGNWHNREKVHFGALRVLNDDTIKGGKGFDTHQHENMEIVTIPVKGALAHKDSTGSEGILYSGDVQIMSAGSGIRHSEFNASHYDNTTLLQIWIFPKQIDQALKINQDARLALTRMSAGTTLSYRPAFPGNGIYIFLLEGEAKAGTQTLERRDGLGVIDVGELTIQATAASELLAIEVPMFA